LRNNSRTQVQSEKIVISSLSVNDTVESLTTLGFTRKKYSQIFLNLSIFHFVNSGSATNPIRANTCTNKKNSGIISSSMIKSVNMLGAKSYIRKDFLVY
jgi:hypothetical protein